MNEIIRILMERDNLTEIEAMNFFEDGMQDVNWYIEQGDFVGAEYCFEWCFGLEPDYFDYIF